MKYNNTALSYDGIGNLTGDVTWRYTWHHGRQLASMAKKDGSETWSFTYDANGMRTSRTKGSKTYEYVYNGGQLTGMVIKSGTSVSNTLRISYDSGKPMFLKLNGVTYQYVTNVQGDVIAILDADGKSVVEYTYDAWGNILDIEGSKASDLGVINPLRYRGYVYDQETGLYYLQSRYYNPTWGRFVNGDEVSNLGSEDSLVGLNLFAYCSNNPVNRTDSSGNWSKWATAGVIVGAVLCIAAVTILTCGVGTATLAGAVAVGAAKGALIGAAVGTVAGAGIGYAATGTFEGAATGAAIGFGAGAVVGAIAGGACGGSNYIKASTFLKSNGANPRDVLSTYKGTPKVQTLNADTTVYRTWGGNSGKYGHWVSPQNYGANAKSMLSLPPGNTAENLSTFVLREGTSVLSGKAAPLFGQAGGGIQWWVGHLS